MVSYFTAIYYKAIVSSFKKNNKKKNKTGYTTLENCNNADSRFFLQWK
jgi:hypothetical protein